MPAAFEEFDEAAWDYGDDLFEAWKECLYDKDLYHAIGKIVMKHRMGGNALGAVFSPARGLQRLLPPPHGRRCRSHDSVSHASLF
jgi:hypothetical protein